MPKIKSAQVLVLIIIENKDDKAKVKGYLKLD